jgi:hypothetical protein
VKTYEPVEADTPCGDGQWKDDGCRIKSRATAGVIDDAFPIKPRFVFFPNDAHITTDDSHAPNSTGTGEPTGTSFASTPFEIYYTGESFS